MSYFLFDKSLLQWEQAPSPQVQCPRIIRYKIPFPTTLTDSRFWVIAAALNYAHSWGATTMNG